MLIRAEGIPRPWTRYLTITLIALFFANFIALAARVAVWPPFSPVPITGQTLAVLLTGWLLGPRQGAGAVLLYLAEGVGGLPVFAGGAFGPVYLFGPTGGYLVGFVAAAALTGWLAESRSSPKLPSIVLALLVGNLAIYLTGSLWLDRFLPGGLEAALATGVLPYLLGDVLKGLVVVAVLPSAQRLTLTLRSELERRLG